MAEKILILTIYVKANMHKQNKIKIKRDMRKQNKNKDTIKQTCANKK